MTDAHARIDSLKEDIREIGFSVLDLQDKAAAHDSKLEQVLATQLAHGARFDAHDARFDQIDARLDAHDARFDQIDARLAEVLARLPQRPQ
jgi:chromosome segregation ATPase